ncbi:MAG: nuclear transport factor 2 family protein [Bacteroidetes bacterium]|nr:nuclear transport factor 2 family protein [Bacteroidota bacterium]
MREEKRTLSTQEVADRFHELAQQEKWFEIQDEFFAADVRSVEPEHSVYLGYAEGKTPVRNKGMEFVQRIRDVHKMYTSAPIVSGNHFVVGRTMDITVQPHGRIRIEELMVYEVKDGKIVLEQFFY